MSKIFEKFAVEWLFKFISHLLDTDQFGAVKGHSISHNLIEFVNFILFNQDLKNPRAVLALMVDLTKTFNRIDHHDVITSLLEMGVPGWLLKIVAGFLSDRHLIVRMNDKKSSGKDMPGGGPRGTILGLLILLIIFNLAGSLSSTSSQGEEMAVPIKRRKPLLNKKCKFVDDLTVAKSIDFKSKLRKAEEVKLTKPLDFHQRTEHYLPIEENEMQNELNELEKYCDKQKMRINIKKTNAMFFQHQSKD